MSDTRNLSSLDILPRHVETFPFVIPFKNTMCVFPLHVFRFWHLCQGSIEKIIEETPLFPQTTV